MSLFGLDTSLSEAWQSVMKRKPIRFGELQ